MKLIDEKKFMSELITKIGTSEEGIEIDDISDIFNKHLKDLPEKKEKEDKLISNIPKEDSVNQAGWFMNEGYNQCLQECEDQ